MSGSLQVRGSVEIRIVTVESPYTSALTPGVAPPEVVGGVGVGPTDVDGAGSTDVDVEPGPLALSAPPAPPPPPSTTTAPPQAA
ncbi:hypothetical protein [Sorangium sp. So ce1151]|uniref:hypothetical protein n=1 Tax=Sorangium sp. So ce1151 TaxID=3133332 RepID=UPI003F5F2D39